MNISEIEILLKQTIGLDAASVGLPSIERAVQQRLVVTGLSTAESYLEKVRSSPVELQELIEAVVVSETWFFRDPEAFAVLAEKVLQEWLPAHPGDQLRILSVPCATGEEPYSIAMTLTGIGMPPGSFHIDAVDVSERALACARRAIYGRNSFRGRNLEFRDLYFEPQPPGYHLSDAVRRRVLFQRENLFGVDFFPGSHHFNFIFCRNLLIYLDQPSQDLAIRTLKRLLTPEGLLFVGPAEAPLMLNHSLVSIKRPLAFAFRKGNAASRKLAAGDDKVRPRYKPAAISPVKMKPKSPVKPKPECAAPVRLQSASTEKPTTDLAEARRQADAGRLQEAAKICETFLKQHRPTAEAHHLLGVICDAIGDEARAGLHYRKALYLDPNHYEALMHLAYFVDRGGDDNAARNLRARADRIKEKVAHA